MRKDIPLKNLHFGHEADPPINARKVGRERKIESLAASIDAHGLGQALNVREIKGKVYVEDGNRRLAALRLLEQKGNITGDTLVKCDFDFKDGVGRGELSLALNFEREPMHEADQFEKFYELYTVDKLSAGQIAARFGEEEKRVAKFLALGALATPILDAWRNDELGDRPWEIVHALTLAPNLKEQEAVFKRLSKSGRLAGHTIREALGGGNADESRRLMMFVGREAYEKAGGKVTVDLFGDNDIIHDPNLLPKLVDARMASEIERLKGEGWSWVAKGSDLKDWRYNWANLFPDEKPKPSKEETSELKSIEKLIGKAAPYEYTDEQMVAAHRHQALTLAIRIRGFTVAQKSKSGAVLSIDHEGALEVVYSVQKPEEKKATAKVKPTAVGAVVADKGPAVLSNSLSFDLDCMFARAVQQGLKDEEPVSRLAGVLAAVVVKLITPDRYTYMATSVREQLKAMANGISPAVMTAALTKHFNTERYFKNAPKDFVIRAIREAVNPDQAAKLAKGTKSAAWKFALDNVPKTGWLPPELRTSTYTGPGASR